MLTNQGQALLDARWRDLVRAQAALDHLRRRARHRRHDHLDDCAVANAVDLLRGRKC